jgi:putative tricarboxylic transport membrane protein
MSETSATSKNGAATGRAETIFTFLLFLFAIFFIWQASTIKDPPSSISVGSRTFPFLIGGLMLLASIGLLIKRFRSGGKVQEPESQLAMAAAEEEDSAISDWPAVGTVFGFLIGLFLLLEPLGFCLSMTLFIFGLATFFNRRIWLANLVVGVGFSGCFYYLFTQVLEIPLPNGILSAWF